MTKGQRVVCVNDQFPAMHRQAYQNLPVKDVVYTIRAVFLGRSHIAPAKPGDSDGEVGLLLVELRNQDLEARFSKDGREPGFSSTRFAPLVTETETKEIHETVDEPVLV